jgi:hypothetical protein
VLAGSPLRAKFQSRPDHKSYERSLVAARGHSEPAAQITAREMEIVRIKGALQRAEELSDDVAAAIEPAL